jgi:hypothetical protein
MPITTTIDHDRQLTIHTVTGKPSFEELMTALNRFWEGQPTRNLLWNFSEARLAHISYSETRKLIDYVRPQTEKRAGGKTALVSSRDLEYGMSRTLQSLREFQSPSYQIEVFRSLEEASQWFDQEED